MNMVHIFTNLQNNTTYQLYYQFIFRNKTNLIWSCIKWINPTTIIITSTFGEILKVELQQNNSAPVVTLISETHKDVIFSLACSYFSYVKYILNNIYI